MKIGFMIFVGCNFPGTPYNVQNTGTLAAFSDTEEGVKWDGRCYSGPLAVISVLTICCYASIRGEGLQQIQASIFRPILGLSGPGLNLYPEVSIDKVLGP